MLLVKSPTSPFGAPALGPQHFYGDYGNIDFHNLDRPDVQQLRQIHSSLDNFAGFTDDDEIALLSSDPKPPENAIPKLQQHITQAEDENEKRSLRTLVRILETKGLLDVQKYFYWEAYKHGMAIPSRTIDFTKLIAATRSYPQWRGWADSIIDGHLDFKSLRSWHSEDKSYRFGHPREMWSETIQAMQKKLGPAFQSFDPNNPEWVPLMLKIGDLYIEFIKRGELETFRPFGFLIDQLLKDSVPLPESWLMVLEAQSQNSHQLAASYPRIRAQFASLNKDLYPQLKLVATKTSSTMTDMISALVELEGKDTPIAEQELLSDENWEELFLHFEKHYPLIKEKWEQGHFRDLPRGQRHFTHRLRLLRMLHDRDKDSHDEFFHSFEEKINRFDLSKQGNLTLLTSDLIPGEALAKAFCLLNSVEFAFSDDMERLHWHPEQSNHRKFKLFVLKYIISLVKMDGTRQETIQLARHGLLPGISSDKGLPEIEFGAATRADYHK